MSPIKAVHTWSLFRTLGRFVAPGACPVSGMTGANGDSSVTAGLELLQLPAALARHGYQAAQLCHFYLPRTDANYLNELRVAFAEAGVELETFLVDDGDLVHPVRAAEQLDWLSGWVSIGEALGASRVRVPAGQQPPSPDVIAASGAALSRLAARHPQTRVVIENWLATTPDAAAVNGILDAAEGSVGLLLDLGNWKGDDKYDQLASVADRAETCQAKVETDALGRIDEDDYRRSLGVLAATGYTGALAMVHDGPDHDEWGMLDQAWRLVNQVF